MTKKFEWDTSIWMKVYVAETQRISMTLSLEEFGAYMLLVLFYWQNHGPFPDDPKRLARMCNVSEKRFSEMREVLTDHFEIRDGEWQSPRLDHEIEEARAYKERLSERGRKGAAAMHAKRRGESS